MMTKSREMQLTRAMLYPQSAIRAQPTARQGGLISIATEMWDDDATVQCNLDGNSAWTFPEITNC
jgi:hypothetical protein